MVETDERANMSEPVTAQAKPKRAILPWLLGLALAAAIGVALFFAWPDITGRRDAPAPDTPAEMPADTPAAPEPPPAEPAPSGEVPLSNKAQTANEGEFAQLLTRLEALEKDAARPPSSEAADRAIAEQLTDYAARLEAIERRPASEGEAASVARDAELGARLATMESRLAVTEAASAEAAELRTQLAALHATAEGLAARVSGVEAQSTGNLRLVALVAAKAALMTAARDGAALAHEVSDLRALLGDAAPLGAPLEEVNRYAEHGALNYEALRARFPSLARDVVRAAAKPDADAGWVDETIARLGSIVTVRKTGGTLEPGSVDERLVRAERALAESDGATALDALAGLTGGDRLEAYRTELNRRVALDEAVRAIDRHVTGLIAARIVPSGEPPAAGPAAPPVAQ